MKEIELIEAGKNDENDRLLLAKKMSLDVGDEERSSE